MGYISKDIAVITEPKQISLATNPNFVVFEARQFDDEGKRIEKQYFEVNIEVKLTPDLDKLGDKSTIKIKEPNSTEESVCTISGTIDDTKVTDIVFYVSEDITETTENIRNALLANEWVSTNFEIKINYQVIEGKILGNIINIKSKGAGDFYNISIEIAQEENKGENEAYTFKWVNDKSINNDSLSGEKMSIEVELDIFEDTNRFLGTVEETTDSFYLGKPLLSVQKTYTGIPIWFELNALFSKKVGYNAPTEKLGWYDTATISDFRFVAKTKRDNNIPFYYSDPLYVLNGYGYSLDPLHLEPYIYNYNNSNDKPIKLLSNKLSGTYIKGQKEYINFIFSDEKREGRMRPEYKIGVAYKLYTFSGEYINTIHDHEISRRELSMVNTCVIDLTETLNKQENANTGKVEIVLTCDGTEISESLKLEILPKCLHKLNTFTFLNKLGGWDSFNMDAEIETESKQTINTYNKTITPDFGLGDSRETVYSTDIELTNSLETKPLEPETRVWLQEFLASPVIFDADGNYVIIKSSKLPISKNMETFSLKYQLSDKYNG